MISFNFHYGPVRKRTGIYVSSEHMGKRRLSKSNILSKLVAKPVAESTSQSSQNSYVIVMPSPVPAFPAMHANMLSLPSAVEFSLLL